MEPAYAVARALLRPSLAGWFRWSIEGLHNIPASGPAILAFNHVAFFDPLAAAYAVDKAGRRPRFLAKAELWEDWRISWVLEGAGQIPVERGSKDAPAALDAALDALHEGEIVVIFPEGTITRNPDLSPMEAKSGVARLALGAGLPVIPAALWGTANVWSRGYKPNWKRGQDICVRVGEPMELTGDPESPDDWARCGEEVMARIGALVASLRPVVPDRRVLREKEVA